LLLWASVGIDAHGGLRRFGEPASHFHMGWAGR
jgi:hypothetical protein